MGVKNKKEDDNLNEPVYKKEKTKLLPNSGVPAIFLQLCPLHWKYRTYHKANLGLAYEYCRYNLIYVSVVMFLNNVFKQAQNKRVLRHCDVLKLTVLYKY